MQNSKNSAEFPKKYVVVKQYVLKELAAIYNLDKKTFRKYLQRIDAKIGERNGYYYNVKQVIIIFQEIPLPHDIILVKND